MIPTQSYFYGSYIQLLSEKKQIYIEQEVKKSLIKLGYKGKELEQESEYAMSSRLSDIENLIDVKKVLKIFEKSCTQIKS